MRILNNSNDIDTVEPRCENQHITTKHHAMLYFSTLGIKPLDQFSILEKTVENDDQTTIKEAWLKLKCIL